MNVAICMTSWKGRIDKIKPVLESLFKQTFSDFKLYLTLSKEELGNYPLPDFLTNNSDERLIINWIEPNHKTMKKVLPVLKLLSDDVIIITADDDVIYDEHFIEYRLKDFKDNNCKFPITSNRHSYQYSIKSFFSSCGSLFTKEMLNGYEIFVNKDILKTYDDDWAYTFIILLNQYRFKPCTKYPMQEFQFINQDTKSSQTVYKFQEMIPIFQHRIMELFGKENFAETIEKIQHNTLPKVDWKELKKADKNPNYIF